MSPSELVDAAPRQLLADSRPDRRRRTRAAVTSRSDRRACRFLVVLVFLAAAVPGALNFAAIAHANLPAYLAQPRTATAKAASTLLEALVALTCLILIWRRRFRILEGRAGFLLLQLFALLSIAEQWVVSVVNLNSVISSLVFLLLIWALWTLELDSSCLSSVGWCAGALYVYCFIFGLLAPSHAFFTGENGAIGESTKAFIGHDQLAGVYGHSNTLGIVIALTLPTVCAIRSRRVAVLLLGLGVFDLLWTASRTALIASSLSLAVVALAKSAPRHRVLVMRLSSIAAAALVVLLPLLTKDPAAFTRRGAIWIASIGRWHDAWAVGRGADWYARIAQVANDLGPDATSGHNLFVTWMTTGGTIACFLGAGALFEAGRRITSPIGSDGRDRRFVQYWIFLCFLILSATEYMWVISVRQDAFFASVFLISLVLRTSCAGSTRIPGALTDELPSRRRIRDTPVGARA